VHPGQLGEQGNTTQARPGQATTLLVRVANTLLDQGWLISLTNTLLDQG
jgi:hypothetical protein